MCVCAVASSHRARAHKGAHAPEEKKGAIKTGSDDSTQGLGLNENADFYICKNADFFLKRFVWSDLVRPSGPGRNIPSGPSGIKASTKRQNTSIIVDVVCARTPLVRRLSARSGACVFLSWS